MKKVAGHSLHTKFLTFIILVLLISQGLFQLNTQAYNSKSFNYFNQLEPMEKAIYLKLKNISPNDSSIILTDEDVIITAKDTTQMSQKLDDHLNNAFAAFIYDYPEFFWLQGWQRNSGYQYEVRDDHIRLLSVKIDLWIDPVYSGNRAKMKDDMQRVIDSFQLPPGSSRYDTVKLIHDWLASRVVYDDNAATAPYCHEPYGALVQGRAASEGYAKAFKLLCDKYEIPCVLVMGVTQDPENRGKLVNLMWNYVQMEDSQWYAVDVCWDDHTEKAAKKIFYDYFLVGSETFPWEAIWANLKFSHSHIESKDFLGFSSRKFSYPLLSKEKYDPNTKPAPSKNPSASPAVSPGSFPENSSPVNIRQPFDFQTHFSLRSILLFSIIFLILAITSVTVLVIVLVKRNKKSKS